MKEYKIAHFADVHFRGLTRHDEYRKVFEQAFRKMREDEVDAIFIAGDIVHTKTQGISPEVIQLLTWWFSEMSKIAPTYVFLGNHDGLIHNADRQDAITPIIDAMGNSRLMLFKKSGNYSTHMKGIRIANYSCFDEDGWKDVSTDGEVVIAVFHGAVKGSLTDSDFPTEGETDLSLFKGCHFGLFGDIHKYQFLDSERRFAYPGSTIQQNYGESLDKGFLLWKIRGPNDFDVERRILKNPHPHFTIGWAGSVDSTIASISKSMSGAKFRISSDKMLAQDEIKVLTSFLKDEMKASEVVWKWDTEIDRSRSYSDIDVKRKSLRDPETHREFLSAVFTDPDEVTKGMEIISKLMSSLEEEDVLRNQKWSLDKLSWDNTFSYGKGNVIDFNELTGVIGLFGRNRAGKSSIPGTLMYTLFNDTDRGSISNLHVVNTRKDYCQAVADISVAGVPYRVERQTVKRSNKKGQVSASTQLNLFKLDESGEASSDMSGEQRRDSEKVLRKLIGGAEDFLLTSFAAQGEMNNFIRQKASSRKYLLSRFLDLQVLEFLHLKIKEETSSLKNILKSMPEVNFRTISENHEIEIKTIENKLFSIEQDILTHDAEKKEIHEWLLEHSAGNVKQFTQTDIDEIEQKIKRANSKLALEKNELENLDNELADIVKKINSVKFIKENFPITEHQKKVEEFEQLESKKTSNKHSLEKETIILNQQEKSAAKLSEVPCGESFPSCKFIKDSIRDKKLIESQRETIQGLKLTLKEISNSIESIDIDDVKEKVKKYNVALSKEKILNSDMSNTKTKIAMSKSNIEKCNTEIVQLNTKLEQARMNFSNSPDVEIASIKRRRIVEIDEKLRTLNNAIVNGKSRQAVLTEKISNLKEEEERFTNLRARWTFYHTLQSIYNKDGIPMTIVRNELPRINSEIAKILQGAAGFTVALETDESGTDLEIYIDYGDSKRPIELGSGMEKMLSSLAIRVALISISSLPKSDILIIDEGFGALDEQNVEACNRLLRSLKRFFKTVIVISHVDAVKDAVDGFVEITSRGQDAYVVTVDSVSDSE